MTDQATSRAITEAETKLIADYKAIGKYVQAFTEHLDKTGRIDSRARDMAARITGWYEKRWSPDGWDLDQVCRNQGVDYRGRDLGNPERGHDEIFDAAERLKGFGEEEAAK